MHSLDWRPARGSPGGEVGMCPTNAEMTQVSEAEDREPIFVRAMSRSGGTLMVTILDAHPDVAMSYELYPYLLEVPDPSENFLELLIQRLERGDKLSKVADTAGTKDFGVFVKRLPRGGVFETGFLEVLRQHLAAGMTFRTSIEQHRFMERCCVYKMKATGKKRWGLKCTRYSENLELWPHAHFINMVRDGRDVLASQMNTGNFNRDPAAIGHGWSVAMDVFRKLMARPEVNTHPVVYEKLVTSPESEIRALCRGLNLEYTPEMLRFHEKDLTIFHTRHLSSDRISKPIDDTKIGRWRQELNDEQLKAFYLKAKDMMIAFGYLESDSAD